MNQKIKLSILAVSTVGLVFAGLFAFSVSQSFPFTSDLRVEEGAKYDTSSYLTVFDGETLLGNIYFTIEPGAAEGLAQNRMTISFSLFYNQTELDSITIRFSAGQNIISVFREASSYTWGYQFHTEGSDVVFEVPDLGWFGSSTVTLNFMLFPMGATNLHLDMQLSMHRTTPLQLTSQKAQVHVDAVVPKGNA